MQLTAQVIKYCHTLSDILCPIISGWLSLSSMCRVNSVTAESPMTTTFVKVVKQNNQSVLKID